VPHPRGLGPPAHVLLLRDGRLEVQLHGLHQGGERLGVAAAVGVRGLHGVTACSCTGRVSQ
jgi:hypothetical protein